jgi:hypothetical protein
MSRPSDHRVDDSVLAKLGPDFVERRWLHDEVEQALRNDTHRYVLVLGEPGAGKTSLLAGMAREHTDWLHYFVEKASRDIQSFLESIGHQLARRRPEIFQPDRLMVVRQEVDTVDVGGQMVGIRIGDLETSPFHRTAMLVEQQVATSAGTVTGIEIGKASLEPRLREPDNLAELALIRPARVLLEQDKSHRIVILLDALDELASVGDSTSLLRWLTEGPELPPNVRVIMSSRPHSSLDRLRATRAGQLTEIVIDPRSPQVNADLRNHAERVCRAETITAAVTGAGLDIEQFQRQAVHRAAGNMLYLSSYLRALQQAVTSGQQDLVQQLLALDDLPPGLSGLYGKLVTNARETLNHRMLEIRDPVAATDTVTSAWEGVGQPILGVLTVARDRLTLEQLREFGGIRVWPQGVQTVVDDLRWLMDVRDGRVAFFHSSIGEYLIGEQIRRDYPALAIDEGQWHERIVRHYRGPSSTWAEVDWTALDRYGFIHLAEHVAGSRAAVADTVTELVCPGLRRAMRAAFGTDQGFLSVVEIAAARTMSRPLAAALPTVLYLAVVRRQLSRRHRRVPPAVLGLMTLLGRTDEALAHLTALPPSRQQFEGAREILRYARADPSHPNRRTELVDLLAEIALTMPSGRGWGRGEPKTQAAPEHAPHDLPRALRLWNRAQQNARDSDAAPDPVFRSAAAVCDPEQALQLIASIQRSRAGDYLDLAARADPAQVPGLLLHAETSLVTVPTPPGERLHCLARLAVAWARLDPPHGRRMLAHVIDAAGQVPDDEGELASGLVRAAEELSDVDRRIGQWLLDQLEDIRVNGRIDKALLRAAKLWAAWGSPDRARSLLTRLVDWDNSAWTTVRAAAVLGDFDRAAAWQLIHQAHATIPPAQPEHDLVSEEGREGSLRLVAMELAKYDLRRAEDVAREMANIEWSELVADRYTVLAELAHHWLTTGNTEQASRLLDEALDFVESAPALVDVWWTGPYRPATDNTQAMWKSRIQADIFLTNHDRDWQKLRDTRFFLEPADVVHAISPGSWSVANPYSWARTVRIFAEAIADQDIVTAGYLVRSLTNNTERAVGLAGMVRAAARSTSDPESTVRWFQEFTTALDSLERFEWVASGDLDNTASAYLRPDHRARFDAATRIMDYDPDQSLHLLRQHHTDYLEFAYLFGCYADRASRDHMWRVGRGQPPHAGHEKIHRTLVDQRPPPNADDILLLNIVSARAVVNEYIAARAARRVAPPMAEIDDPRYAALVDLMAERTAGPAFQQRIRSMIGGRQLPAAAALAALAAEMLSPTDTAIQDLCAEVIAAARKASSVEALLPFAVSPALPSLVDPAELLTETLHRDPLPWQEIDHEEVITGLFSTLLTSHPDIALRLLYDAVSENWRRAMALLERGAKALVSTIGTDVAIVLHTAIESAVTCVSPDSTTMTEVDGVRLG